MNNEIESIQSHARNQFGDIPLERAMIAWAPLSMTPDYWTPGAIVILPHGLDDGLDWFKHYRVSDSTGACWTEWRSMTPQQRLLKLYIEAWHIVCRDGLAPRHVHAALSVIPEYRNSLSGETFFADFRFKTPV